jgi:TRAP-type C4-dicarboxylate transport system permease small subunit
LTSAISQKANNADRVVQWATRLLGLGAAVLLFAMMVLTFVDVWGRYFFNSPVPGGFEVTELMMAALIFAGLPLVTAGNEHVAVDLLDYSMPHGMKKFRDALVNLLCAGMLAILSYRLWLKASEQVSYGDQTAILNIPSAPVTFFMSFSTAFSALVLLALIWGKLVGRSSSGHQQEL